MPDDDTKRPEDGQETDGHYLTHPACVRRLRRLSVVPRWAIVPMIRRQNVAEHSYHTAWIAVWVVEHFDLKIPIDSLLWYALTHDQDEALSGDIAAPYKSGAVGRAVASRTMDLFVRGPELLWVLKVADLLEARLFIEEETRMGNRLLGSIAADIEANLNKVLLSRLVEPTACRLFLKGFLAYADVAKHPGMETTFED